MEKNSGTKVVWPPKETSLNDQEKAAYRHLVYRAMLNIRNLCQSRGSESCNPFEWWRQYRRSRVAGALADCRCRVDIRADVPDYDVSPSAASSPMAAGISGSPRGPDGPHERTDSMRLERRVLALTSLLVIGG
jgi:hypothetical protein